MDRIKGNTLDSFPDYIEKRFGKGEVAAFAGTLSPEAGKVIREGAVKSTWYSRAVYFEILAGFAQRYGGDDPSKLVRDLAAYAAERDLKSIYRFFLRFGYPGFVIGKAAVLWKSYFEGGSLEVISRSKNGMVVRLTDDVYLPYTCDLIIGYGERATTLSGGKDVTIAHPVCKHRGGPHCEFQVAWA